MEAWMQLESFICFYCSFWWTLGGISNHSLKRDVFETFFFLVGSNFRKNIYTYIYQGEILEYSSVCLSGKIRVQVQGSFWGLLLRMQTFLQFTPGPNATTQLVFFFRLAVSGDYELVKIVEGKPSYKKVREGLRSMELWWRQVICAHIIHHKKPVSPFTGIFFAFFISFLSYHT